MPCTPCQARRRMIAAAKAKGGASGVVKVLPAVAWHVFRNPPTMKRDNDGGSQQSEA